MDMGARPLDRVSRAKSATSWRRILSEESLSFGGKNSLNFSEMEKNPCFLFLHCCQSLLRPLQIDLGILEIYAVGL